MNATTLQWVQMLIEGGLLLGVFKVIVLVGRVLQKLEDHDARLTRVEDHLFPVRVPR